jgi:hypothetical protein
MVAAVRAALQVPGRWLAAGLDVYLRDIDPSFFRFKVDQIIIVTVAE